MRVYRSHYLSTEIHEAGTLFTTLAAAKADARARYDKYAKKKDGHVVKWRKYSPHSWWLWSYEQSYRGAGHPEWEWYTTGYTVDSLKVRDD